MATSNPVEGGLMDDLPIELRDALDIVIYDLRLGATTRRRIRNLVASAPHDERLRIAHQAVLYLQSGALQKDDPLIAEVVDSIVRGLTSPERSEGRAEKPVASGAVRDFKGRELSRVPHGTQVEFDGVVAVIRGGRLHLPDGHVFDHLSPAARHVTGQAAVNGWKAWRVVGDGRYLGDYYDDNHV